MRLSADGGLTWTNVVDNGPLDMDLDPGVVTYAGPVGNWLVVISQGLGVPASGTSITPIMDMSTTDLSAGPATLIVQMSDTSFVPFPNETFLASVSTTTAGTLTYNVYRDSGNVLFGSTANYGNPGVSPSPTAIQLFSEGPLAGSATGSNAVAVANGGSGPYSLTLETLVTHTGSGTTLSDSLLTALPPPACDCTLVFNSPAAITNCAGDAIPDVTATQTCRGVSSSVFVNPVSVTTNGVCPQVITRNFTATDNCGTTYPFTQTITVNCQPDCTITTVTAAIAGSTNLSASVADAGPGATYVWSISNGTITGGQGTTKITWTAGNANNPTSLFVTVTAATGCQSSCSASVRINPPPVCSIPGVIISNTSWNKFNIPSGTSPVVWVHMHIGGLKGIPTNGVNTIQFTGVTLYLNGTSYALPDGTLVFDSSGSSTPTTTFSGGKWTTTINPKNLSDEIFFDGAAIPVTASIAAGAKADLTYNTVASVQGISFNWQWSAAVYTFWPTDWNQALILPFHGNGLHAGTPQNTTVQKSLIQGPRGGGGSNYTGSWSATGSAECQ